jgi:hypothetical protein
MMVLTEKEKIDMTDVDVAMSWMLQPAVEAVVGERKIES